MPVALIVDDEARALSAMTELVEKEGFSAISAGTLAEARGRLAQTRPDVVLVDLMLPDGNGLELFQAIRFAPEHPRGGVVILTEPGDIPTRERAHQLGAAAVLSKPIRGDELVEAVEDLLTFIS